MPRVEEYDLKSQMVRASTSVVLNIAEGSTGQSDKEQNRFLGFTIRSLVETVACFHLIKRRQYLDDLEPLRDAYRFSEKLFAKLQAFRTSLKTQRGFALREEPITYDAPF